MKRDFTYIDDLVHAVYLLIDQPYFWNDNQNRGMHGNLSPVAPFRVINIGNSNLEN